MPIIYTRNSTNTFSIERVFSILKPVLNSLEPNLVWLSAPVEGNSWVNRFKIARHVATLPSGLIHLTGDIYFAVLLRSWFNQKQNPIIITIHDIEVLKRNTGLKRWLIRLLWFALPIKRAQVVTVISNETKLEVEREFRVHPNKIKVIYNPLDPTLMPQLADRIVKNRLLAIGTKQNKNLDRVLKALKGLPVDLCLVGVCSKELQLKINESGVSIIQRSNLSQEELIEEYANCNALLFASTIEGFGLPILEAQAMGRPVITSNCSSMPEVAGKGAEFVDPYSVKSIRSGVVRVLESEKHQQELIQLGFENCKRFEVTSIAKQYIALYKSLER